MKVRNRGRECGSVLGSTLGLRVGEVVHHQNGDDKGDYCGNNKCRKMPFFQRRLFLSQYLGKRRGGLFGYDFPEEVKRGGGIPGIVSARAKVRVSSKESYACVQSARRVGGEVGDARCHVQTCVLIGVRFRLGWQAL